MLMIIMVYLHYAKNNGFFLRIRSYIFYDFLNQKPFIFIKLFKNSLYVLNQFDIKFCQNVVYIINGLEASIFLVSCSCDCGSGDDDGGNIFLSCSWLIAGFILSI